VAVPNVTAIDWKQADVKGQALITQGGMSFTVMRLVPPLLLCTFLARSTWRKRERVKETN
jgi:hypothetical protein